MPDAINNKKSAPVGLTDRRDPDHVDVDVEVAHHPPDQRQLLVVLLAEERDVVHGLRGLVGFESPQR